jgi:hypothetical protein
MIAAVYARKSTTQSGREEADKSVGHQLHVARAFAAARGWAVAAPHVGAEEAPRGLKSEARFPRFATYGPALRSELRACWVTSWPSGRPRTGSWPPSICP